MEYESWYPDREIDTSIVEQFRSAVKGPGAELHSEFIRVRDLLAGGLDNEAWRQRQRFRRQNLGGSSPTHVWMRWSPTWSSWTNSNASVICSTQRPRAASWHIACSNTRIATRRYARCSCRQTPYKMYTLSHESG